MKLFSSRKTGTKSGPLELQCIKTTVQTVSQPSPLWVDHSVVTREKTCTKINVFSDYKIVKKSIVQIVRKSIVYVKEFILLLKDFSHVRDSWSRASVTIVMQEKRRKRATQNPRWTFFDVPFEKFHKCVNMEWWHRAWCAYSGEKVTEGIKKWTHE
jgi:hypothetical protein